MLLIKNLSFSASGSEIIRDFSICIYPGGLIYLKGKNGSGKTTFLRILAGIKEYDSGSIHYRGIEISDYKKAFAFYLGHKTALKNSLKTIDQLKYWTEIYKSYFTIDAAIRFWNIEDMLDKTIESLSEGNKKKLSLSRLFFSNSNLWLLDEVDVNLDNINKNLLQNAIKAKLNSGGIVIISTHNENYIEKGQIVNFDDYKKN